MSKESIKYTLTLKPLNGSVNPMTSESEEHIESSWLDNNDPELLSPSTDVVASNEFNSLMSQLSEDEVKSIVVIENLSFTSLPTGFECKTNERSILLVNGQILQHMNQLYKVQIDKEVLVSEEAPMAKNALEKTHYDDIWGELLPNNAFSEAVTSPNLSVSSVSQPPSPCSGDALGFLYQNNKNNSSLGMPTLPYDQAPSLNSALPGGLPQIASAPLRSHQETQISSVASTSIPTHTEHGGNVLNDLGIHPNQPAIRSSQQNGGKSTFAEQSPMDFLDEFLNDPQTQPIQSQHAYYVTPMEMTGNHAYPPSSSVTPSLSKGKGLVTTLTDVVRWFKD